MLDSQKMKTFIRHIIGYRIVFINEETAFSFIVIQIKIIKALYHSLRCGPLKVQLCLQ